MKDVIFNEILNEYRKWNHREAIQKLVKAFPLWTENTLLHIAYQEFHRITKRNHWKIHHKDFVASVYARFNELRLINNKPGYLLHMADSHNISPSLLAKLILEQEFLLKNDGNPSSNKFINSVMRDTTLIEDAELALEIHLCVLNDRTYGPYTEALARSTGFQYEEKLKSELRALNLSFSDEDELRNKGYDKTPDVKLNVPFAVSGHVVNWIESKASFGDPPCHKEFLKYQYLSYINRFGPGIVIYWFGFVDELDNLRDQGLLLYDHVPNDITYMKPLS